MKNAKDKWIEIYCDGACSGNPGPGGYGALLKYEDKVKEISGCDPNTTNNRMEMTAAIEALKQVKRPARIRITTDSNYLVKGMTQWINGWIKRNWINSQKKPVLNRDLWEALNLLCRKHEVEWKWIKGHAGHLENERCDHLARKALEQCTPKKVSEKTLKMRRFPALGCLTYGIYVLTTCGEGIKNGMIASWVSQVSHEPPLIMTAIHPNRYSHHLLEKGNAFALHILSKDQKNLLGRFKGPDPEKKFDSLDWSIHATGCPVFKDCVGYLVCRVVEKYTPGNHTLFIGEVLEDRILSHEETLTTNDYEGVYVGRD